jgi:hypothetical protein
MLAAIGYLAAPLLPWSAWRQDQGLAAWVQAIFSVVAILVAIAVPYFQRRAENDQRRATEVAAAQVAGAGILLLMNQTLGGVKTVLDTFADSHAEYRQPVSADFVLGVLGTFHYPTDQDLLLLTPVLPECAVALVRGRNLLLQAKVAIALATRRVEGGVAQLDLGDDSHVEALFAGALSQFEAAAAALDSFCV